MFCIILELLLRKIKITILKSVVNLFFNKQQFIIQRKNNNLIKGYVKKSMFLTNEQIITVR